MVSNSETGYDRLDLERAEWEGMEKSGRYSPLKEPLAEHLLDVREFLDQVVELFYSNPSIHQSVDEAAGALVRRLALVEFALALDEDVNGDFERFLEIYLGTEHWLTIQEEQLIRQVINDITLDSGTPG